MDYIYTLIVYQIVVDAIWSIFQRVVIISFNILIQNTFGESCESKTDT